MTNFKQKKPILGASNPWVTNFDSTMIWGPVHLSLIHIFSVFRIYADQNNQPAAYSPENVPYHPDYFAPVSLGGYEQGSFCITMGYPGSTSRYLSSFGIDERINTDNAAIDVYKRQQLMYITPAQPAIARKHECPFYFVVGAWSDSKFLNLF